MILCKKITIYRMPRAGSTWLTKACEAGAPNAVAFDAQAGPSSNAQHWTMREAANHFGDEFARKLSYVQVRQPYFWLRSVYYYGRDTGSPGVLNALPGVAGMVVDGLGYCTSWDEFFEAFHDNRAGLLDHVYQRYTEGVDFIGYSEMSSTCLVDLLRLVGEPHDEQRILNIPAQNVTRSRVSGISDEDRERARALREINPAAFEIWDAAGSPYKDPQP